MLTRKEWLVCAAVALVVIGAHFAVWLGGGHI